MTERALTPQQFKEVERKWLLGVGPSELHDALGWTKEELAAYKKTGELPTTIESDGRFTMGSATPTPSYPVKLDTNELAWGEAEDLIDAHGFVKVDALATPDATAEMPQRTTEQPQITPPMPLSGNPFLVGADLAEIPVTHVPLDTMRQLRDDPVIKGSKPEPEAAAALRLRGPLKTEEEVDDEYQPEDFADKAFAAVKKGDQVTIVWNIQGGIADYVGIVLEIDPEWIYIKGMGSENYLRTPLAGVRLQAHLRNVAGKWVQGLGPGE